MIRFEKDGKTPDYVAIQSFAEEIVIEAKRLGLSHDQLFRLVFQTLVPDFIFRNSLPEIAADLKEPQKEHDRNSRSSR